jgi:hypothetical protein
MTAQQVYDRIVEDIRAGRDEAALAYWQEVGLSVEKQLTAEQYVKLMDFLSSAEHVARAAKASSHPQ